MTMKKETIRKSNTGIAIFEIVLEFENGANLDNLKKEIKL